MKKITLYDWEVGFNKIGLTKLLRSEPGFCLQSAKLATDSVLDRKAVIIEVANDQIERMTMRLNELGVRILVDEAAYPEGMQSENFKG